MSRFTKVSQYMEYPPHEHLLWNLTKTRIEHQLLSQPCLPDIVDELVKEMEEETGLDLTSSLYHPFIRVRIGDTTAQSEVSFELTKPLEYDDLIELADERMFVGGLDLIKFISKKKGSIRVECTLTASVPERELALLDSLGMVQYSPGFVSSGSRSVVCKGGV